MSRRPRGDGLTDGRGKDMLIFGIGILLVIGLLIVDRYDVNKEREADRRALGLMSKRQNAIDVIIRKCEEDRDTTNAKIADVKDLLRKLDSDFIQRIDALNVIQKSITKEFDFIQARQHGMDKRIAGLKREVVVTVNGVLPPAKSNGKGKGKASLLNRAGVAQ